MRITKTTDCIAPAAMRGLFVVSNTPTDADSTNNSEGSNSTLEPSSDDLYYPDSAAAQLTKTPHFFVFGPLQSTIYCGIIHSLAQDIANIQYLETLCMAIKPHPSIR